MKINELGRSMVEMLGVLAIIGVLSVGALSGYNKAMMKYKLNKHAYQISQLINAVHMYQYQFRYTSTENLSLVSNFQKLNLIPDGMKIVKGSDVDYLKDAFGSYSSIYINRQPYNSQTMLVIYGKPKYEAGTVFTDTAVGITWCRNILESLQTIFKESSKNFCYIYLRNQGGGIDSINLTTSKYDFANMSTFEMNNICEQQINASSKKQLYLNICFNNQ